MKILETAIYAVNLEETARFYDRVMGLERIVSVPDRHVFFRLEDSVLLIFNPQSTVLPSKDPNMPVPSHGGIGPGHVCFSAAAGQIDYWIRKLSDALIEVEADFTWPAGGRSIYFRDPAGNSIEFAEPRIWGFD